MTEKFWIQEKLILVFLGTRFICGINPKSKMLDSDIWYKQGAYEYMEIKTQEYNIWYDPGTIKVTFSGSLRLSGMEEYEPIVQLLNTVTDSEPSTITLDLQKLEFLNSSGINVLSKFVLKVRQKGNIEMLVQGSKNIPWQGKSLKNLQRLMPSLQLELE